MAKEKEKILTKENARAINLVIDITEDGTLTLVDNNLQNVATVVIKDSKVSVYTI